MTIEYAQINREGLSKQIADAIRDAIVTGGLLVDERLPGEHELAERFGVSRPTVREALKRLAAQNLIRTQRGPTGGAFVNRLSWSEAHDSLLTTARLVIGMNDIAFDSVAEARFLMERACLPLVVARHDAEHIERMRQEIAEQERPDISDEEFCASDVRFHRALVDATDNPLIAFEMVGMVEAMQPLLNMLTYRTRDRAKIADLHQKLVTAVGERDLSTAETTLDALAAYTTELAEQLRRR